MGSNPIQYTGQESEITATIVTTVIPRLGWPGPGPATRLAIRQIRKRGSENGEYTPDALP